MVKPTDYVLKACIVKSDMCKLDNKCEECKKEIENLQNIDKMFKDIMKTNWNDSFLFIVEKNIPFKE